MSIKNIIQKASVFAKKHSPEFMTGIGIISFGSSILMAIRNTPKYNQAVVYAVDKKGAKLNKKEKVKLATKYYVGPVIMFIGGSVSCISACSVSLKRNTALATILAGTEATLETYQKKTLEAVGEQTYEKIKSTVSEENAKTSEKNGLVFDTNEIIPEGKVRCIEGFTNQKFYASKEDIRKLQNDINELLTNSFNGFCTLNDYVTRLPGDLNPSTVGDELWWDTNHRCKLDIDACEQNGKLYLFVAPKNYTK